MIDQAQKRAGHKAQNQTENALVDVLAAESVDLAGIYESCTPNQCHWIPIGRFFLYVKRKYNHHRRRNELELISLTPNQHATTLNRTFAKPLKVPEGPINAFSALDDSDSDDEDGYL